MRSSIAIALLLSACAPNVGGDDAADTGGTAGAGLGSDTGTSGEGGEFYARVCASGPTVKGIDVAYYQGTIDWATVHNGGYQFAFMRVSDGTGFHDPKFATYWAGASGAGVIRGPYQYFEPAQNVTAQADLLIAAIGGSYTTGDLPPVLDVEATGGLGPSAVAAKVRQWVDYVKGKLGVDPIVYTGKYFWRDQVGGPTTFVGNPLWIAQYTTQCPDLPAPWTTWKFWQFSGSGHIAGVSGSGVDLDSFNGTLADLQAFAGGTPASAPPPPPTTCSSATLDRDVGEGVCVQAASDANWYECESGMWVARSSTSGCAQTYAWCSSATLGEDVPPRTCVQAASDHVWYQCDGTSWATPVNTATAVGPAGDCSSVHEL